MKKLAVLGLLVLLTGALASAPVAAADLNVIAAAAFTGNFGLQVDFSSTSTVAYVQDNSPTAESRYRARMYVSVAPASLGGDFDNFYARSTDGAGDMLATITLGPGGVTFKAFNGSGDSTLGPFPLAYGWHAFEIDWQVATSGANGTMDVWVDGVNMGQITGLSTVGSSVESAQWGFLSGTAPTGSFYLDDFVSTRDTYIGLADSGPPVAADWDGDGTAEKIINRNGAWFVVD